MKPLKSNKIHDYEVEIERLEDIMRTQPLRQDHRAQILQHVNILKAHKKNLIASLRHAVEHPDLNVVPKPLPWFDKDGAVDIEVEEPQKISFIQSIANGLFGD